MRTSRGFTLIETIIALGILAIALTGALSLIFKVVDRTFESRYSGIANGLLQGQLTDAVSILCTGCEPQPPGADNLKLGTHSVICIDEIAQEDSSCPSGYHPADRFREIVTPPMSTNPIPYTLDTYIDENFDPIPEDGGSGEEINSTNSIKVITRITWSYKFSDHSDFAIQYVKKQR